MNALTLRNLIVDQVRDVDAHARAVLHVLARFADAKTLECYPAQERIAECAGLSVRHVREVLAALVTSGYIEIAGQRRVPRGWVRVYRLVPPHHRHAVPPVDARPPAPRAGSEAATTGTPCRQSTPDHRHTASRPPAPGADRPPARRADKQIKENRSGNRSPTRADRAGGGVNPSTSSLGGLGAAKGKKKTTRENWTAEELALVDYWLEKHPGEIATDADRAAARRLLKHDTLEKAKARVDVAAAKGRYAPGGGTLVAIARNPNAFSGKPEHHAANGKANGASTLKQPLAGWAPAKEVVS